MAQIRPETEDDRTEGALAADGLTLPLTRGSVEIDVVPGVEATTGGQRLVAVLVNVLARMKGVVRDIHLVSDNNPQVSLGTPLRSERLTDGLVGLAASLNTTNSRFRASLSLGRTRDPDVR